MVDTLEKRISRTSQIVWLTIASGAPDMPNGRSGGFALRRTQAKKIIDRIGNASLVVGQSAAAHQPMNDVTLADLSRLIHEFPSNRIWIEEHDHRWYIMHLDWPVEATNEPVAEKWIIVKPGSPLFVRLRGEHGVWRRIATRIRTFFIGDHSNLRR